MKNTTSRSKMAAIWIVVASVVLTALTFLIPVVESSTDPMAVHWRTAAGTMATSLYIGAAVVLLGGLKVFKKELRVAYRLMAFGILSFSLAMIQLIIWGVYDLWDSEWATSGSGLLPYVLTAGLIYVGARKFTRLLGIKTILNSFAFTIPVSLVATVAMYFIAAALITYDIPGSDVYVAVGSLCSVYLLFASILAYKIYTNIGAYYKTAMKWLFIGMVGFFLAAAHESVNTIWFNNGSVYTDWGYYLIPWTISGLLLVRASYQFRLLPSAAVIESTEKVDPSTATTKDFMDSLVTVAGLVSQPDQVDAALDDFRGVTAHLKENDALNDEDKKKLVRTYLELETYLASKDPLRVFSKDQVRGYVTPAFKAVVEANQTI